MVYDLGLDITEDELRIVMDIFDETNRIAESIVETRFKILKARNDAFARNSKISDEFDKLSNKSKYLEDSLYELRRSLRQIRQAVAAVHSDGTWTLPRNGRGNSGGHEPSHGNRQA